MTVSTRSRMRGILGLSVIALLANAAFAQRIITTFAGRAPVFRGDGGLATNVSLRQPSGVAVDASGNLFIADDFNARIRQVTPEGVIRTVAGNGIRGFSGDGGPAKSASLVLPQSVAVDELGNLFVSDSSDHRIRQVTPDGVIRTVAGNGFAGFSGDGVLATSASLNRPGRVAVDAAGNLFIADTDNHRIRQVTPDGVIRTVAGNGIADFSGDGGAATDASLRYPGSVAVDAAGNLFIADDLNARIRQVTPGGVIRTVAGNGIPNSSGDGGPAIEASLFLPRDVAVDAAGSLFIADDINARIRQVTPDGVIRTVAGNGRTDFSGDGGPATEASLSLPRDVAVDAAGNLFIADTDNGRIRQVGSDGVISTVAGSGIPDSSGDGGPPTEASLSFPAGVAADALGNLFIADSGNARVRQVTPDGVIRTVAGNGFQESSGDGGPATEASLDFPQGVAVDGRGNLFIVDSSNVIRQVTPDGLIRTVAGNRNPDFSGDGGPATEASLNFPQDVAADDAGNLFIADAGNFRIRQVNPDSVIRTVAGGGRAGSLGDGGPATDSSLNFPVGVAVDELSNLFVADSSDHRIRQVTPDGLIRTVAGNGIRGLSGDGRAATSASLNSPDNLAVDAAGNLFIADTGNFRVRQVTPDGVIQTVAGDGSFGFSGDGGPATEASLSFPVSVAADPAGNLFIADQRNSRIRAVLAEPPRFGELPVQELSLSAHSGAASAETEPIPIEASVVNLPSLKPNSLPQVSFSASTDARWLTASPRVGMTPRLLRIKADPAELAPGDYQGTVTLSMPHAQPAQQVISVRFSVGPPLAPALDVDADSFSFTYPAQAPARQESLVVFNTGGGDLDFSARPETDSGGDWLRAAPSNGKATPRAPASVEITADPSGLDAGTYTGRLNIAAGAAGSAAVSITMTVSEMDQAILLTQRGLSFTTVADGGVVPPQSFGVVNLGRGSMDYSVATCTLAGLECDWLEVTPASGSSAAGAEVPEVVVTVDQTGLAPGEYFGLVEVRAAEAANTPQVLTVFLRVLPERSDPGAALTSNELTFTGIAGASSPSSQDIEVYNVAAEAKTFRSSRSLDSVRLEIQPQDGRLDPERPTRVVVQPFTDGATPGEYDGNITLQFSDGRVQEVGLKLVLTRSNADAGGALRIEQQTSCTPTKLFPTLRTLPERFSAPAGWPVGLQVEVKDDCGQPLNSGNVVVQFVSRADADLKLTPRRNGLWDGTWQTGAAQESGVSLRVRAESEQKLVGEATVRGSLEDRLGRPGISAVVSAAAFREHQPLGPGSLISLFGEDFAEDRLGSADGLPLPTRIGNTEVFVTDREQGLRQIPLLFAGTDQVNAVVPYRVALNTNLQIVAKRGRETSLPIQVNFAAAQPAIFLSDPADLAGQGHIYRDVDNQQSLATPDDPARAGDVVVIYASGLGEVDFPVGAGHSAPSVEPLARTVHPVTVTIGGRRSRVLFAGLAPGFAGLYQVNASVPEGVEPGDRVDVRLHTAGQTSPRVTMAVR